MQSNTKKLYNPTSISPSIFIIKYSKWVKRRKYGREENEENKWKYFTYVSFNLNYQFVCICAQTTKAFSLRKNFPNFPHHVFCLCLCFSFCVHYYRFILSSVFPLFAHFVWEDFFHSPMIRCCDLVDIWLILLLIRQHRGSDMTVWKIYSDRLWERCWTVQTLNRGKGRRNLLLS